SNPHRNSSVVHHPTLAAKICHPACPEVIAEGNEVRDLLFSFLSSRPSEPACRRQAHASARRDRGLIAISRNSMGSLRIAVQHRSTPHTALPQAAPEAQAH